MTLTAGNVGLKTPKPMFKNVGLLFLLSRKLTYLKGYRYPKSHRPYCSTKRGL